MRVKGKCCFQKTLFIIAARNLGCNKQSMEGLGDTMDPSIQRLFNFEAFVQVP
jgi:hypothetical protein